MNHIKFFNIFNLEIRYKEYFKTISSLESCKNDKCRLVKEEIEKNIQNIVYSSNKLIKPKFYYGSSKIIIIFLMKVFFTKKIVFYTKFAADLAKSKVKNHYFKIPSNSYPKYIFLYLF